MIVQGRAIGETSSESGPDESGDFFERLEALYKRIPDHAPKQKPLIWPWMTIAVDQKYVADQMVMALGSRPASRLLPYLDSMSPNARAIAASFLAKMTEIDAESRGMLVRLVGDPAGAVRETAVKAMTRIKLKPDELPPIEALLDRKKSDLRRSVLSLILSLDDAVVLESAGRLTESKSAPKRLAGLDLLRQMHETGRSVAKVRAIAQTYRSTRKELSREEQVYLNALGRTEAKAIALDDAAGLMDPNGRTPPAVPRMRDVKLSTPATVELIELVDGLIHEHREVQITLKRFDGDKESQALGSIQHGFPGPFEPGIGKPKARSLEELPLRDVWFGAWEKRPNSARDSDGLEAARALLVAPFFYPHYRQQLKGWRETHVKRVVGTLPDVKYPSVLYTILEWFVFHQANERLAEFVVDAFETVLASIPADRVPAEKQVAGYHGPPIVEFRQHIERFGALRGVLRSIAKHKNEWTDEHTRRMFSLARWIDEPLAGIREGSATGAAGGPETASEKTADRIGGAVSRTLPRDRVDWNELMEAIELGAANQHDLFDHLLGGRSRSPFDASNSFGSLQMAATALHRGTLPASVVPIVGRVLERVLEIELERGEKETCVTPAAMALGYTGGLDVLVRVLQAIGNDPKLQRSFAWGASQGKMTVFSHLIQVTFPGKSDTHAQFAEAVRSAGIDERCLLAVAFYAPQWARHVQAALGWPIFEEAVWWFHAHTKDNNWRVGYDVREAWNAEIRKLTPLSLEDLMEGAVDVAWFERTHEALGEERWARLDEFAKYSSGGAGHKRRSFSPRRCSASSRSRSCSRTSKTSESRIPSARSGYCR